MSNIITIAAGEIGGASVQTVNARDLHSFLESKQQFADWVKGRIEQYSFIEGQDFTVHKFMNGRATQIDYHISVDMAKELSMVERNDKGKQARQYFIECERQAKETPALNPANLSRLQLIQIAMEAEEEKLALEAVVAEQAPKVEVHDRIAYAEGSLTIRESANTLRIPERKFVLWLQQNDWVYRRAGHKSLLGYAEKVKAGYLYLKQTPIRDMHTGEERLSEQVRITPLGLTVLARRLSKEGQQVDVPPGMLHDVGANSYAAMRG